MSASPTADRTAEALVWARERVEAHREIVHEFNACGHANTYEDPGYEVCTDCVGKRSGAVWELPSPWNYAPTLEALATQRQMVLDRADATR